MDNRGEELRKLASEVGQIAYGVHEPTFLHALHDE